MADICYVDISSVGLGLFHVKMLLNLFTSELKDLVNGEQ